MIGRTKKTSEVIAGDATPWTMAHHVVWTDSEDWKAGHTRPRFAK